MIWVMLGGGLGSALRYWLQINLPSKSGELPVPTLLANVIACFILGLLTVYLLKKPEQRTLQLMISTGFCGGLSTFSTLIQEFILFWWNDNLKFGVVYLFLSLASGLLMVTLGYLSGNFFLNQQHDIG